MYTVIATVVDTQKKEMEEMYRRVKRVRAFQVEGGRRWGRLIGEPGSRNSSSFLIN